MKQLIKLLLLILLLSLPAKATITGTDRGGGGTCTGCATDQSTLAIVPSSNFTANSFGVLIISYDNDGGGGADSYSSIADDVGNTWTARQTLNFDPGAANAGVVIKIFTSPVTSLTTSNTITITWSAALVAKAWVLMEFTASANFHIEYLNGGTDTGVNTNAPTLTTGSITSGNAVIAAYGAEWSDIFTMDSDTTNGTWVQNAANHTQSSATAANTSMSVVAQRKIATGTGTQTYDPTLSSAQDTVGAWIEITEVADSTIKPSAFFFVI